MDNRNPTLPALVRARIWSAQRERWFRIMVRCKKKPPVAGFFDAYPRFFSTSSTASERDRLNQRYSALIQSNANIIADRRILDIASHDGRWSLAAYKTGAEYVLGIEARRHLIEAARSNMLEYQVPDGKVQFLQSDVLVELDHLEAGRFDTVFCFGFLYHTIDHMALFRKIARLNPTSLVIDTAISIQPGSIVEVRDEEIGHESTGAVGEPGTPIRSVVGKPSREALELMLRAAGFPILRYFDWLSTDIKRWDDLKAYYMRKRISLTAMVCAQKS